MKQCPKCFRFYSDETLNYCLDDGTNLEKEKNASLETSPTEIFGQDDQQTEISFSPTISSSEAIHSLAILPLVNKNSDPDIEYLSDGITESIIYSLSRLPKLRVMAYSTISRYKGQQADPIKIGRELRVRAVLAGRLLQFQDKLTISTELVDIRTGAQLWGEQFRRPVSDILAVQEEISGKVLAGSTGPGFTGIGDSDFALARYLSAEAGAAQPFDFDGDGRADISVYRPSLGGWYIQRSRDGLFGIRFGRDSDKITPADFDGDGKADIAVYRPSDGTWYIVRSTDGTFRFEVFGLPEDLPVPGDFDADGKADISVFRPSSGTWFRMNSSTGAFFGRQFGQNGDRPVVGDFDGDGRTDLAVFRPQDGIWFQIQSQTDSFYGEQFGAIGDVVVPADYDGDRRTDLAVYRPSNGFWYVQKSSAAAFTATHFGAFGDIAAPADYDGDGKADICVFRASEGQWYRLNSSNGMFDAFPFGLPGDRPTQSAYQ